MTQCCPPRPDRTPTPSHETARMFPGDCMQYPSAAERAEASALIGKPITGGNRAYLRAQVGRWLVKTGRWSSRNIRP